MSFALAQDDSQGGQPTGPPPCDEWLNSDMAQDMNGDGVVDEGDCPGSGPPPFEDVDTNGDGSIDREEARAMFGHDDEGNPDPDFDEEYDKIDTNGDGEVDHAEYMAADDGGGDHDGGGTCDVCGHEYGGEGDHHGHCRVCGAEMNTDDDWRAHCDENWEHCKPQAGDTCGYVGPSGDECGYVHTGAPDEDHHHCDTCGMPVNSGAEMEAHCNENPEHCGGGDHEDGDGDGPPTNHWDGNCGAMSHGESEYWVDSDGDPDNGAEDGPYAVWYEDADGNSVDCGGGDHDGPPPFEDVDTNGDGSIDREEARAMFGHDDEGNPDPDFDE